MKKISIATAVLALGFTGYAIGADGNQNNPINLFGGGGNHQIQIDNTPSAGGLLTSEQLENARMNGLLISGQDTSVTVDELMRGKKVGNHFYQLMEDGGVKVTCTTPGACSDLTNRQIIAKPTSNGVLLSLE